MTKPLERYHVSGVLLEALSRVLDTLPMGTTIPGFPPNENVRGLRNAIDQERSTQEEAAEKASRGQQVPVEVELPFGDPEPPAELSGGKKLPSFDGIVKPKQH